MHVQEKHLRRGVWGDQRGVTGLETAIVLIAFVVVAAVFAVTIITTGMFSSEKAGETANTGLDEASTSLTPKGAVVATANAGKDAVATVKFKLTTAAPRRWVLSRRTLCSLIPMAPTM